MLRWPTLPPANVEGIGLSVAAVLTLAVLSAAFGRNRVSSAAFAVLIGTAVGYAATVTWWLVLWPRLWRVLRDPAGEWPLLIWFLLGLLLLARGLSTTSWLSNVPLALLLGVGAALAVAGAALGTALPLALTAGAGPGSGGAPRSWVAVINTLLVAVGTGGVLLRFAYTARGGEGLPARLWAGVARGWGRVGYVFILVGFGALFAAAIISLVGLLVSRLQFRLVDCLLVVSG